MSRFSAHGAAWEAQRQRVLDRDAWVCVHCGRALEGADATVDHVTPVALQPAHEYADHELLSLCRSCNASKGDRVMPRIAWFNPRWIGRLAG